VLLLLASSIASSFDNFLGIRSHPGKESILMFEMHPFHLHGYNFFVVGRGYGNYDLDSSLVTFDVINPPFRNTYVMLAGSRVAIQFQADNLGWFSYY
jgi:laccase